MLPRRHRESDQKEKLSVNFVVIIYQPPASLTWKANLYILRLGEAGFTGSGRPIMTHWSR